MSEFNTNFAALGMDLEQSLAQLKKGKLTYALNATIEGADGQYVNYQNILGNESCVTFPVGYKVIGVYAIYESNLIIYWLLNPETSDCEIGSSPIDGCTYSTIINAKCLNFNIDKPVLSAAHRISNCSTQVFWVDGYNKDRFIDLNKLPYEEVIGGNGCESTYSGEIDCNKLCLNPLYSIPQIAVKEIDGDGTLTTGTYQFAIQYANANGEGYTSYHSLTNPIPIFDVRNVSLDFNLPVNRSIVLNITDIDVTGFYDYYNLAVIKTVNNISTPELVGTFSIKRASETYIYTGQRFTQLAIDDVLQKYPIYETSEDLTTINDILVRDQLTSAERLSYQEIANQITIYWQTWKLTKEYSYKDPKTATDARGFMRDEVYPFEVVFLLDDGRETDRFHIPGRIANSTDTEYIFNADVISSNASVCEDSQSLPRWKIYNTGNLLGFEEEYLNTPNSSTCYAGPYQYGEMSYWESTEEYPCNKEIWGNLEGQKIRHHKFPDSLITHIHDNEGSIYPIGIKVSIAQIRELINNSSLTLDQKRKVVGFKVTRGNRANNKTVVAKGLIHNVGLYSKDGNSYFYPNYPYNDRSPDLFISNSTITPYPDNTDKNVLVTASTCNNYQITPCCGDVTVQYVDCGGVTLTTIAHKGVPTVVCSSSFPVVIQGDSVAPVVTLGDCSVSSDTIQEDVISNSPNLQGFTTTESKERFVFHSPDTHFYQPFLGNTLKLETIEYGKSKGHFVQTKEHARYKLYTLSMYGIALGAGIAVLYAAPVATSATFIIPTYGIVLDILQKITPRINYAYQYNSIGNYNSYQSINNDGNKQRLLDISIYMNPGMATLGDIHSVNNFQRESSVYLKTQYPLPYTDEVGGPVDNSRWKPNTQNEFSTVVFKDISSYYASIKKSNIAQYGQIYSYDSVDTGFQFKFTDTRNWVSVFGGDIYINKFAYKSKLPYFFDNRVKSLDDSDVFYNELGNVGVPNYWFSTDPQAGGASDGWLARKIKALFGVPITKLDTLDLKDSFLYKKGKMYLFSYGIPYFYCESEINVDYRQAFNNKEGDFYPHVSTDIPDEWLQEVNVPIVFDNTYYYNKTLSKQNSDNYFSFLPVDYSNAKCKTVFPYRTVYSEPRTNDAQSTQRNNWLIYKPISYFDFPQNFGKLTALDGMEYRQVLARFENRTQIYNALLTAPTSQANVYLGQPLFSSQTPPIDLSNTDMGYMGSRHKFLLKTEFGMISCDDKRGQVFLINGQQTKNLTATASGVEQFFNKNLEVVLPKYVSGVPIDNHFNGVGIHGVYDAKYNQVIITKLDYQPIVDGVTYSNGIFYLGNNQIELTDERYFCNKSFTMVYDFDDQCWISFMSILPSYYVGSSNFYLSGFKDKSWRHYTTDRYCYFYDEQHPYVIEYPYSFQIQDEILQAVVDYSKVLQYVDGNQIDVDDVWYNKAILYNNQQCSGVLEIVKKPKNNLSQYMTYPFYNSESKTILYTKSDNLYKINQFWSLVRDNKQPIFRKSCQALYIDKELNQPNMDYGKLSFKKSPLRAKDLKCRFILDNRYDTRIVSQISLVETQKSFK